MSFTHSSSPPIEKFVWTKMRVGSDNKLWHGCIHCQRWYSKAGNLKNHLERDHQDFSATSGSAAPAQRQGSSLNPGVMSPIPCNPVSIQLQHLEGALSPGPGSNPMGPSRNNSYSYNNFNASNPWGESVSRAILGPPPQQFVTHPQHGHRPGTAAFDSAQLMANSSIASPSNTPAIPTFQSGPTPSPMPANTTEGFSYYY